MLITMMEHSSCSNKAQERVNTVETTEHCDSQYHALAIKLHTECDFTHERTTTNCHGHERVRGHPF